MKPRLLDLFCGEGGAAAGYMRAGWEVYGVDLKPTCAKRYPGDAFWDEDAVEVLGDLVEQGMTVVSTPDGKREAVALSDIDAIHASPPCQGYSIATAGNPGARAKHQRLIAATRELLQLTGVPWVIENVEQARSQMVDPVLVCGRQFGLEAHDADGTLLTLDRHRLFESNVPLDVPDHPPHRQVQVAGVYGGSRRARRLPGESLADVAPRDRHAARHDRGGGYVPRSIPVQQALLGIDWMSVKGMQESIPPAYAQFVGSQLLSHLATGEAA